MSNETIDNIVDEMRSAAKSTDLFNGEEVGEPLIRGMKIEDWADRIKAAVERERMASRVMYHATPKENVESIMEKGIVPQHSMVYLSHRPDSWAREGDGLVVLMVRTSGLEGKFSVACGADDLDEVIYWGAIPPANVMIPPYGKRELSNSVQNRVENLDK